MNDDNKVVDDFIKGDIFSSAKSIGGSIGTKIRRYNSDKKIDDSGLYKISINKVSLIAKTESMPECICLIEVDGEIVFCIEADDTKKVREIMLKLNPGIEEYNMIFRPIFKNIK